MRQTEQTVIGDAPNLAARLQALAEPGAVLICPRTHRLAGAHSTAATSARSRCKAGRSRSPPGRCWGRAHRRAALNAFSSRFDSTSQCVTRGLTTQVGLIRLAHLMPKLVNPSSGSIDFAKSFLRRRC